MNNKRTSPVQAPQALEKKLSAALRENLLKRKQQARARKEKE
jgi:hypothetical protein